MAIIAPDIGIDLGTSYTRIYVKKQGLVIDEPSIAVSKREGRRLLWMFGREAYSELGRTAEGIQTVYPVNGSKLEPLDIASEMLQYFVRKAIGASRLVKPRVVIATPTRMSTIEQRSLRYALTTAGLRNDRITLVPKPYAAAMGAQLDISGPHGYLVVDVGGGGTEVSVISLSGLVAFKSIPMGGLHMNSTIAEQIHRESNLNVGQRTLEESKLNLGSALPLHEVRKMPIRGRNSVTNLAEAIELNSNTVYQALNAPCQAILTCIRDVLGMTPPEICSDILRDGIFMTGGGSQLFGLDRLISIELDLPVNLITDAAHCTINGVGFMVEDTNLAQRLSSSSFLYESNNKE